MNRSFDANVMVMTSFVNECFVKLLDKKTMCLVLTKVVNFHGDNKYIFDLVDAWNHCHDEEICLSEKWDDSENMVGFNIEDDYILFYEGDRFDVFEKQTKAYYKNLFSTIAKIYDRVCWCKEGIDNADIDRYMMRFKIIRELDSITYDLVYFELTKRLGIR